MNFRGLTTQSGFDPIYCRSPLLDLAVQAVEEWEVFISTMTYDEGRNPAAFFELFERNTHRIARYRFSGLSPGSRP